MRCLGDSSLDAGVPKMTGGLDDSIGRISALVDRALECADQLADPRAGDAWWQLAASTLPAQVLVLRASASSSAPASMLEAEYASSTECLFAIQAELTAWDWDGLDRETLRAGAQMVLNVADLLSMP